MAIPTSFGFDSTATEVASHYANEIKGKTILVTGVSPNGLGAEAAISIAKNQPKLLILAGRSIEKINETKKEIEKVSEGKVETKVLILDLASFEATKKAAQEVLSYDIAIDVLINNAGVMALPERALSTDGFEMQFASNHLGPFIFTNTILPALKRSSDPRIVVVSSWGHHLSNFIFEDPNAEQSYDKWKRYGSTKTANVQFAVGLSKTKGIKSISLHPGAIRTELLRHLTREDELAMGFINEDGTTGDRFKFKSLPQGAATHIVAAFEPSLKGGEYLDDCQVQKDCEEYALNEENAEKLWRVSNDLTKSDF